MSNVNAITSIRNKAETILSKLGKKMVVKEVPIVGYEDPTMKIYETNCDDGRAIAIYYCIDNAGEYECVYLWDYVGKELITFYLSEEWVDHLELIELSTMIKVKQH